MVPFFYYAQCVPNKISHIRGKLYCKGGPALTKNKKTGPEHTGFTNCTSSSLSCTGIASKSDNVGSYAIVYIHCGTVYHGRYHTLSVECPCPVYSRRGESATNRPRPLIYGKVSTRYFYSRRFRWGGGGGAFYVSEGIGSEWPPRGCVTLSTRVMRCVRMSVRAVSNDR